LLRSFLDSMLRSTVTYGRLMLPMKDSSRPIGIAAA
jgi:hypothetical protein